MTLAPKTSRDCNETPTPARTCDHTTAEGSREPARNARMQDLTPGTLPVAFLARRRLRATDPEQEASDAPESTSDDGRSPLANDAGEVRSAATAGQIRGGTLTAPRPGERYSASSVVTRSATGMSAGSTQ